MDAQYFAEQRRIVLRIAARLDVAGTLIVPVSAVTVSDVKVVIIAGPRTESNPAALVIGLRLID